MKIGDITEKIKQAVKKALTGFQYGKAQELIEKLEKTAAESSNAFWWLKLIALVKVVLVEIEDTDRELSSSNKKTIAEEIIYPIWDEYCPKKIKALNTLTFGALRKFAVQALIDGMVFVFNLAFGKLWINKTSDNAELKK